MSSKSRSVTHSKNDTYKNKRDKQHRKLVFKEVYDTQDLIKCFSLRYQQYNTPSYKYFLDENIHELDIDIFDLSSRHWAVYSDSNEILGYARIVQKNKNTVISNQIQEVLDNYKISKFSPLNEEQYLPIHQYQSESSSSAINQFFKKNKKAQIVELSRFMIPNGSPLRISKFMINAGLGIYKHVYQVDSVVLACNDTHEKFWSLYGFTKICNGQTYQIGSLKSVNLHSDLKNIHSKLSDQLEAYAESYLLNNEISITL